MVPSCLYLQDVLSASLQVNVIDSFSIISCNFDVCMGGNQFRFFLLCPFGHYILHSFYSNNPNNSVCIETYSDILELESFNFAHEFEQTREDSEGQGSLVVLQSMESQRIGHNLATEE